MGFKKDDPSPIFKPRKRTTKVNISLVVGVLIFLLLGLGSVIWMKSAHG
jgi:hypothetical protein